MIVRKVRCPICEQKTYFKDRDFLIAHIGKKHKESIPEGWVAARYENYLRTGKTSGRCVECGEETGWNPSTNKYYRLCKNPKCRKAQADKAEKNMQKKTGMTKSERMSQASVQKKMIYAKHTSGCYKAGDHEIWYDSSYAKEFVEMLSFMNQDMNDIFGPSPNTYEYIYEGKKHLYIPDLYIHTYGLEIEIKDGGDNPNKHPKIQQVDKVKEQEKDKVMEQLQKQGKLFYIKVVNKDYREFFQLLMTLKEKYDGDGVPVGNVKAGPVKESLSFVSESINLEDIPTIINLAKESSPINTRSIVAGKTSDYHQIVRFYLKKIPAMTAKDIGFWEDRIILTLESLREKSYTDKSYDLRRTIDQMEHQVIPKLNEQIDYLKRRGAHGQHTGT